MTVNVGTADRAVRVVVALLLFSSFFWLSGPVRFVSLAGILPLGTALAGWCPLYTLLGLRTCPAS